MSYIRKLATRAGDFFRHRGRPIQRRAAATRYAVSKLNRRINSIEKGKYKELKTFDSVSTTTAVPAGLLYCISNMAQGDTSITREGLQIQPRNLQFKITCTVDAAFRTSLNRIIILEDKEQHGVIPTIADVLEAVSCTDFTEHDTRPRFRIIRDMVIPINNTRRQIFLKGIIKFGKSKKIYYSGTTAADVSQGKNALYVIYMTSESTGNGPDIQVRTRLRFVDG